MKKLIKRILETVNLERIIPVRTIEKNINPDNDKLRARQINIINKYKKLKRKYIAKGNMKHESIIAK